jgi:hypothetical protein
MKPLTVESVGENLSAVHFFPLSSSVLGIKEDLLAET